MSTNVTVNDSFVGIDSKELFLQIFDGVPQAEVAKSDVLGSNIIDLLSEKSGFLKSKGEAKRELQGNAISVNKEKVKDDFVAAEKDLIDGIKIAGAASFLAEIIEHDIQALVY